MDLINRTKVVISFQIPYEDKYGNTRANWYHVEPNQTVTLADDIAWRGEAHGLVDVKKAVEKPVEVPKVELSDTAKEFSKLPGVSDEIALLLQNKYRTVANMKSHATKQELVAVSGLGEKRANKIIEALKG